MKKNDAGNVLFIILIAIALFAALSFSVVRSGRFNVSTDKEQELIELAEIMAYSNSIAEALNRMVVENGCEIGEKGLTHGGYTGNISFYDTKWATPAHYNNPAAPADGSCHVFHPRGGGIVWQAPPPTVRAMGIRQYLINGAFGIYNVGRDNIPDAGSNEITFFSRVTEWMCLNVNNKMGITNPGGVPPTTPWAGYKIPDDDTAPGGEYTFGGNGFIENTGIGRWGEADETVGKPIGCYRSTHGGTDRYYYYHAIVER